MPAEADLRSPIGTGMQEDSESTHTVRDPVCGMTVDPATARHRTEHAGKPYYFCSARCLERFSAEPERFVAPASLRATPAAERWTCPMHPEIVRDRPGACPICGMALEPRTVDLEEQENPELTDMTRRFRVSALLAFPLVVIGMGHLIPGDPIGHLIPHGVRNFLE